jgi:hypothetical protein
VVDMEFMTRKFRSSVCSLLGIPSEMVQADRGTSGKESRGGRSTSRIFQGKMSRMCIFLSGLMQDVYLNIYKEKAEFRLMALPRLEVQGIEDLKILHEIGVLQPDHAIKLSDILLGATARSNKDNNNSDNSTGKKRKINDDDEKHSSQTPRGGGRDEDTLL